MTTKKKALTLIEIGVVILSGFIASFLMKKFDVQFFALPHLVFLLTAIIFRSVYQTGNWQQKEDIILLPILFYRHPIYDIIPTNANCKRLKNTKRTPLEELKDVPEIREKLANSVAYLPAQ